jgi:hypothetical protein
MCPECCVRLHRQCVVCTRTAYVVGESEDFLWAQCMHCRRWYHLECIGTVNAERYNNQQQHGWVCWDC